MIRIRRHLPRPEPQPDPIERIIELSTEVNVLAEQITDLGKQVKRELGEKSK